MATIAEYLQTAQREKASDIYFSVGTTPFLKVNGAIKPLLEQGNLTKSKIDGLAREVLSPSKWSEFKSHGELITTCTIRDKGRLRIVFSNERKGPFMACHLIPSNVPEFESLGLPHHLLKMVSFGSGLILIIGPAKSGKTTTLESLIQHINETSEKSVATIEMPLEYKHSTGKSLIERFQPLNTVSWFDLKTMGSFLKTVDVMVIDGLPLEETISPALSSAAEGLLVLVSLETNGGIAEILARIIQTASSKEREYRRMLLARVLKCAVWQHLLPAKNSSQRIPLFEFLLNDPVTSSLIGQKGKLHLLRPTMAAGRGSGMQTMHQAIEILKPQYVVQPEVLDAFEHELLHYYVSPLKANF